MGWRVNDPVTWLEPSPRGYLRLYGRVHFVCSDGRLAVLCMDGHGYNVADPTRRADYPAAEQPTAQELQLLLEAMWAE